MGSWLLWGPAVFEDYVRTLVFPTENHYPTWAEGGFLKRRDERKLLWFGADALDVSIPARRLFFKLQRVLWPGWSIEWAQRGLRELLAAQGRSLPPDEEVRVPPDDARPWLDYETLVEQQFQHSIRELRPGDEPSGVASIRWEDGSLCVLPLVSNEIEESYLDHGPERLMAALRPRFNWPRVTVVEEKACLHGGFHLDVELKELTYWSGSTTADMVSGVWEGWKVRELGDQFEVHQQLAEGRFELVFPPMETVLEYLRRVFVAEDDSDHEVYNQIHELGESSGSLEFPLSVQERVRIWDAAVEKAGLSPPYPKTW